MQNPLDLQFSSAPKVITAICKSPKVAGGQTSVTLEHFSENDLGARMSVQVVGDYPKRNQRGLVLFPNGNKIETGKGYWLGELNDRFATQAENLNHKKALPENTNGFIDETGNNQILVSSSNSKLQSKRNTLLLNSTNLTISHPTLFELSLDENGFSTYSKKDKKLKSKLAVTRQKAEIISQGNFYIQSGGSVNYNVNGNFIIQGEGQNKVADLFQVKSSRIALESSHGPTTITGSSFNVKVASSIAAPGSSSNTSASIEAVQGDMDFTAGIGDITIRALSATHKIKIANGFSPEGLESYLEVSGTRSAMGAEMAPGLGSFIETTRTGNITMNAFQSIKADAFQSINLEAMVDILIKSIGKAKIESMLIDLISEGKITIEAPMLDMSSTDLIDAGPKTAIPSGAGPFCSIPKCPILGMNHVGEKCI